MRAATRTERDEIAPGWPATVTRTATTDSSRAVMEWPRRCASSNLAFRRQHHDRTEVQVGRTGDRRTAPTRCTAAPASAPTFNMHGQWSAGLLRSRTPTPIISRSNLGAAKLGRHVGCSTRRISPSSRTENVTAGERNGGEPARHHPQHHVAGEGVYDGHSCRRHRRPPPRGGGGRRGVEQDQVSNEVDAARHRNFYDAETMRRTTHPRRWHEHLQLPPPSEYLMARFERSGKA